VSRGRDALGEGKKDVRGKDYASSKGGGESESREGKATRGVGGACVFLQGLMSDEPIR